MHHGDDGVREASPKRGRGTMETKATASTATRRPGQKVARHRRKHVDDRWPMTVARSQRAAVLQRGSEAAKPSAKPSSNATPCLGRNSIG
jgi:hypothetical protein